LLMSVIVMSYAAVYRDSTVHGPGNDKVGQVLNSSLQQGTGF
jgi:hypothetical protein